MRILYHHRILARDGMRVHIDQLVNALTARRHDIHLVGPEAPVSGTQGNTASGSAILNGLDRLRARAPRWTGEMMEVGYNLRAARALRQAADACAPDVLYERYNSFLVAGLGLKKRRGLPMIVEVNAPLTHERQMLGNLTFARTARRMEEDVWRGADAVLPVSDALADHLRAAGVDEKRIHVIPNGVELDLYTGMRDEAVRAELGLGGKLVFGFVGFVRPWHGLDRVLAAFARLNDSGLHLLVVGEGPASDALKSAAGALGLSDRLTFTGARPHADIPRYLSAVDVALQPDVTPYASPLKLFEYMAAGCAVIAPDRPNIREIVSDGETASLFDPDDPDALEAAIAGLAGDAAMRAALGRAARKEIVDKDYTWDGNARRVETIAAELLARRGGEDAGGAEQGERA